MATFFGEVTTGSFRYFDDEDEDYIQGKRVSVKSLQQRSLTYFIYVLSLLLTISHFVANEEECYYRSVEV